MNCSVCGEDVVSGLHGQGSAECRLKAERDAAFLAGVRAGLERAARLDIRVSPNSPDANDSLKADITNDVWKQIRPHLQRAIRAIDPESVKEGQVSACAICKRVSATLRVVGRLRLCPGCELLGDGLAAHLADEAAASTRLDEEETHIHDPLEGKEEK